MSPVNLAVRVALASTSAALCAVGFSLTPVMAQETGAAASQGRLDEIIVTARKREESLQNVPIAVTAFGAETLDKAGMFGLADIAGRTPSFTFQEQQSTKQEIFMRGIGTVRLDAATADPSIGVFLDEIYIGRRGSAQPPMFDLERVEVLRGPQGTLYGRNVVGGAVGMVTAKPEFETGGRLRLSAGMSDGHFTAPIYGVEGAITGALSDTVAGRVAIFQHHHGGYSRNTRRDPAESSLMDQKIANTDILALRGSLLFNLTDALDLLLIADFSHDESDGQCRHAIDNPSVPGLGPVVGSGTLPANVRDCNTPYRQFSDRDTWGLTGRLDWATDWATLTYLAAVRGGDATDQFSQTGTSSPPSFTDSVVSNAEDSQGITQELRLLSNTEGRLSYVAGLYFLRERTNAIHTNFATSFANTGPGSLGDILDGDWTYTQRGVSRNSAVYGELSYALTDELSVTLGGRFTRDKKTFDNAAVCNDFGPPGSILCVAPLGVAADQFAVRVDESWSEFTPRFLVEWQATDVALVYASATRGFKGGGWQSKPSNALGATISYNPEYAWNYEVGAKSDWLDQRLRLNVAAFYTDFQDLQVEELNDECLCLVVSNAGAAEIRGVELEATAFPTDNVQLWLTGSWLDPEYKDFGVNTGNTLQYTPKTMVNVGMEVGIPLPNAETVDLRIEYGWQGRKYWNPENNLSEDSFGILDARLGYSPEGSPWEVSLWGRNLTNETYRIGVIPFLGDVFSRFNAPRSFGVQFNTSF